MMFNVKKIMATVVMVAMAISLPIFAGMDNIEQIVMIRHAEKPLSDLGQLNCTGLNRSMMLPYYLTSHFGNARYIFASNPSVKCHNFSYVRALATIEPTAIALGLPVNAQIGYNDPQTLVDTLLSDQYHTGTIYVSWEHNYLNTAAQLFLKHFNNSTTLSEWTNTDYNRVYVITINWNKKPATLSFAVQSERFDNISGVCPKVL